MLSGTQIIPIRKLQENQQVVVEDLVCIEEPLEINLISGKGAARRRHNLAVTMRTPGQDEYLATGFLFTEGIIDRMEEIIELEAIKDRRQAQKTLSNTIEIQLHPDKDVDHERLSRHFYTSSSCGVCGKGSIELVQQHISYLLPAQQPKIDCKVLSELPALLRKDQALFGATGGIHAAALFDPTGQLLDVQEDVGRHNAMDKLIGKALTLQQIPLQQHMVLVSGRTSFEIVQKCLMAGVAVLASVGAPSSLAVELADAHGMTLIGFLKEKACNIYCGAERITS